MVSKASCPVLLFGSEVLEQGRKRHAESRQDRTAVELKRRPDISYVSHDRWPRNKPVTDDEAWDVVPDLAVEVVSPNDKADGLLEKVEEYFVAGVRQVWVVYPRRRVVHVFESFTQIKVTAEGQELDGGTILPGFRVPLATLFEDLAAKEQNGA